LDEGAPVAVLGGEGLLEAVAAPGRPLMVGDRLDTDIEGAVNAGIDSLLVLTGVTGLDELVAASRAERPTYLSADLAGLWSPHPEVEVVSDTASAGGWTASCTDGRLRLEGVGDADDWWRAVAAAAWAYADRTGQHVATDGVEPPR